MSYVNDFITVIQSIENDNTYKTAWGRAILECINNEEYEIQGEMVVIYHYNLVQKLMKYYWNQIAFFKLAQGPSSVLEARIDEIKTDFQQNTGIVYPVWYDKVESFLKRNPIRFERQVKKFITIVNKGIAAKFERIDSQQRVELYDLDTKFKCLRFTKKQVQLLKSNSIILEDLIDYKWARIVEDNNKSPNIMKKVIGSKEYRFKRQNLIKYRNVLIQYCQLEGSKDFYTNEPVSVDDMKLEYVIPYDFIYTNDIWNTIIVSRDTAKERRGKVPSIEDIERVNKRNQCLYEAIQDTHLKIKFDVERALEEHLIDRYYIDLKG